MLLKPNKRILCLIAIMFLLLPGLSWGQWFSISNETLEINEQAKAPLPKPKININSYDNNDNRMGVTDAIRAAKHTIRLDLSGFWVQNKDFDSETYQMLHVPGWASGKDIGEPALPYKPIMIEIPKNKEPIVNVLFTKEISIPQINVWPTQPPMPEWGDFDQPPFQKNMDIYNRDEILPESNIVKTSIMNMRNHRILIIEVTPFRYNPKQKNVFVASQLEVQVILKPAEIDSEATGTESGLSSPEYDRSLGQGIYGFNYDSLLESMVPEKYMILFDDQFEFNNQLEEFIEWKRLKGYDVVLVKTSEIPAATPGAPEDDEIISYMRNLSDTDYPTYLLIIGNESESDGVAGTYFTTRYGGYTDLNIACRTAADWIPDLFAGRLPASDNIECSSMLTKVLAMDRTPPDTTMYDNIVVAGQIQDNWPMDNQADRLFCETADAIACYFEQDAGGVDYDCVRAIVNPDGVDANCLWQQDYPILWTGATGAAAQIGSRVFDTFVSVAEARNRIITNIDNGIAILQHRDHGSVTGWGDPHFDYIDVDALNNMENLPLVFSINCLTGSYHEDNNFTMSWLNHANGGAYCVIAATDVSYSGYNDWMSHGFYMAFLSDYRSWHNSSTTPDWTADLPEPTFGINEGQAVHLGEMLNFAKMYMLQYYSTSGGAQDTFQLFHVFGDPEALVQLHYPEQQVVSHPLFTSVGSTEITVTTGEDGCMVCLYSQDLGIHEVDYTSGGTATFSINTTSTSTIHVTVSKFGKRPYEGTIECTYQGLEGYWQCDEQSGTLLGDASVNSYDATVIGDAVWTDGVYKGALAMDGVDDYVEIPPNVEDNLTDCTLSLWVYWNTADLQQATHIIDFGDGVPTGDTGSYMYITPYNNDSDNLRFSITTSGSNNEEIIEGSSQLPVGEWVHLAVVLEGDTGFMYRNGIAEASVDITIDPGDLSAINNWIARSQSADPYFNGRIDDFRIYNRALTSLEVQQIAAIVDIEATDADAAEVGPESGTFTITRHGNTASDLTVNYLISGTATNGLDYQDITGTAIIPTGQSSTTIEIVPIADGLVEGNETVQLIIQTDDAYSIGFPASALVTIDDADSFRSLTVDPVSIDLGIAWPGISNSAFITLENSNYEETTVSDITINNAEFTHSAQLPITVSPASNAVFEVSFVPANPDGYKEATVTIESDAEDNPILTVSLSGTAVNGPEIGVAPDNFSETLLYGETATRTMTITNTGDYDLDFAIDINNIPDSVAEYSNYWSQHQKWNYEKTTENGYQSQDENNIDMILESVIPYPFFDGFEDDTYNNWTEVSASYTRNVVNDIVRNGTCAFRQTGGSLDHYDGVVAEFTSDESPETISFSIRSSSSTNADGYFVLGEYDSCPIFFFMRRSGFMYLNSNETFPYQADTWYDVKFCLDWTNFNVDLYIDGSLVAENISFRDNVTSFTRIYLYNYDDSTAWYDNISVNNQVLWLSYDPDTGAIPPGESADVDVVFDATQTYGGTYEAEIQIDHNDINTPSPVVVPCTLVINGEKRLSADPVVVDFADVFIGGTATANITLANNGTEITTITDATINNAEFDFNFNDSLPVVVEPTESVEVEVSFSPVDLGTETGTFTITSDAIDNPSIDISLTGNGINGPEIGVTPDSFSETLDAGSTVARTLNIQNNGEADLEFSISIPAVSWLSLSQNTGTVTNGNSMDIDVTFDASGLLADTYSATMDITHNDPNTINPLGVSCELVVNGIKRLSADPLDIDFGDTFIGASNSETITLTNSGNDATEVSAITINNGEFNHNASLPLTVPAFGSVSFEVSFSPLDLGTESGTLTITSDASDNPSIEINLTGNGVNGPEIGVTPDSFSETLLYGETATRTMTITNTGDYPLDFNIIDNNDNIDDIQDLTINYLCPDEFKQEKLLGVGKPVDINSLNNKNIPLVINPDKPDAKSITEKVDKDKPGAYENINDLLEVFGSTAYSYSGSNRSRGNIFYCSTERLLVEHRMYLNPSESTQIWLSVYEGDTQTGDYTLVSASNISPAGPGVGWYSSGPIDVTLTEGKYYLIIASFEAVVTYYRQSSITPYPIQASFGELIAGVGASSWVPTTTFPPQNTQSVTASAFGNICAYYQALVTEDLSSWLSYNPETGVIPPGESVDVDVVFDANGLIAGTYTKTLEITHNDPNTITPLNVPCELTVESYLTYFATSLGVSAQSCRTVLRTEWNTDILCLGKNPTNGINDLWIYIPDLIGDGVGQIPDDVYIVSAKLVFNIDQIDGEEDSTRHINLYRIIDPDYLGLPYFGTTDGIRSGLDFYYRDHRLGLDIPWALGAENIFNILTGSVLPNEFEFIPIIYETNNITNIQFEVTEDIRAWLSGESNQGWFMSIDGNWLAGNLLDLHGFTSDVSGSQPKLEVIYRDDGIENPGPVTNLNANPGDGENELTWNNPTTGNIGIGAKVVRRIGSIPINAYDGELVYNGNDQTYTDTGITNGIPYYYAVFRYDQENKYSIREWVKAIAGTPVAPATFTVTSNYEYVQISFDSVTEADAYRIYRMNTSGDTWLLCETALTEYQDYNIESVDYGYWVTGLNEVGEGQATEIAWVTAQAGTELPATPTNLTGTPVPESTNISLSWTDEAYNELGFKLKRNILGQTEETIEIISFNQTEYIDMNLEPATTYEYSICAYNSNGDSAYTDPPIQVTTLDWPLAPSNIEWQIISACQINLFWTMNSTNIIDCEVYVIEADDDFVLQTIDLAADATECSVYGLEPGVDYYFRIVVYSNDGQAEVETDTIRTDMDNKEDIF